jgi:hypothetical protein
MKYTFRILTLAFAMSALIMSCGNKNKMEDGQLSTDLIDPENPPVLTFKDTTYDFGTISQGETVKYTFTFTNTGKSSLVIQDVKPTCGCTIPKDWPKQPIKSGESGKIDVVFDSAGKQGKVTKVIRVIANTKPPVSVLRLVGTINAPDNGGN